MAIAMSVSSDRKIEPLITIAIPTFNRASWLVDCIQSCLAQSYRSLEIIVSDNASTDQTQETLKQFDDRRLRVVTQKSNVGSIPNFNACLSEARGDYIVFVPDDERIEPWMLERFVDIVSNDSEIPIVVSLSGTFLPDENRMWRPPLSRKLKTGICDGLSILQEYLRGKITINLSSMMFRTEALRGVGGFPIAFPHAADVAAWSTLLLSGKTGFVNDYGGFTIYHKATQTSYLGVDARVKDVRKVADLIIELAERSIADPQKRHAIEMDADCFFALRLFQNLAWSRDDNTKLIDMLPTIWQWWRQWSRIGLSRILRLGRPLAVLFLPKSLSDGLVRILAPVYRSMLN